MLNYSFISDQYRILEADRKKKLIRKLFGEGNQTIAYFKNGRDSRFSKIEILSDFFGVPIDMLREGTHYTFNPKEDSISIDKNQRAADRQKIELLEERIKILQDALAVKEERISLLNEKNEFYKSIIDRSSPAPKEQ